MLRALFVSFKQAYCIRRNPLVLLLFLVVVVSACGGSASNSASMSSRAVPPGAGDSASPGKSGPPTLPNGTPVNAYLIRSLNVSLRVTKPLEAEHQITQDIFAMDPQALPSGENITEQRDGSYIVALTFAVSAPKYGDVKAYLNGFSKAYPAFKGKLAGERETVQNVTSQYVDLQSRLKNLRTEQQRLLQLMSQAQNLTDTLTIQDKLTEVEGQIEQIEGQINQLDSQVSYSTVTVNLAPISALPPPPPQSWNPGQVFGGAASALLVVLQVVADVLIWLLVFSVLWLPIALGVYFWRRAKQRRAKAGA